MVAHTPQDTPEYHPHDTLAKIVMEKLARGRELIPEAELRVAVSGDVVVRPGAPLPAWTGLLGELVGTDVCVLEFYFGRPRAVDLMRARAKGLLACALEKERTARFDGVQRCRVLVVTIGRARKARREAYGDTGWLELAPGYSVFRRAPEHVHLDLWRLAITFETAWVHIAGSSPRMEEALALLAEQGEEDVRRLLRELRTEVTFMPEIQKVVDESEDRSGALRFVKAWERAMLLAEGTQKGRQEGRQEGLQEGIHLVVRSRFGSLPEELQALLGQFGSVESLEGLLAYAAVAATLEDILSRAREMAAQSSAGG